MKGWRRSHGGRVSPPKSREAVQMMTVIEKGFWKRRSTGPKADDREEERKREEVGVGVEGFEDQAAKGFEPIAER